jgi:hypothetical protein
MDVNRISGMAFRRLSEPEIKWLRKKMNDTDPAISAAARKAHRIKFPHYERNEYKKGLTAFKLEFYIHADVFDEFGDELSVHMRFIVDDNGEARRIDYDLPKDAQETVVHIEKHVAKKYLKALIHQDDALYWHEDLSDFDTDNDPFLDILPEQRHDYEVNEPVLPKELEPVWMLRLELNNGEKVKQTFYNNIYDAQIMLFWDLMGWFEDDVV